MRIAFDGKYVTLSTAGVGRYCTSLLRALFRVNAAEGSGFEFVVFLGPDTAVGALPPVHVRREWQGVMSSVIRSTFLLPGSLRRLSADLFHGLDGWLPASARPPGVVTIHDLIPLLAPRAFTLKHRLVMRWIKFGRVAKAAWVIADSAATKGDLQRLLGIPGSRISVIPLGVEDRFHPAQDPGHLASVRATYRLPADYVLFVGTLEPRKNLPALLRAFARLRGRGATAGCHLVLVGGWGWQVREIREALARHGGHGDVHVLGFVADEDLPALYAGAKLFVFPSTYEGFGLPVLEAMACGVPVVTSTRSSLPEVGGDAARLIDPDDVDGLAEAMGTILDGEALRRDMAEAGLRRARLFSWEAAARETLKVYQMVGAGR